MRAQEENFDGFYEGYLWVDVFPVDAVPDSDAEYKKFLDIATFESHLSLIDPLARAPKRRVSKVPSSLLSREL